MTSEPPALDRLTASDLFLLMWDDYHWSTDIGGLAVLDGATLLDRKGRVDVDMVRGRLGPRLPLVPRFRQLLIRPRPGLGWPLWVDAPAFDITEHIKVHAVPDPGDEATLLQTAQHLAQVPFDPDRPLWALRLLPGLPDGRIGALLKLHHVIADGAAALAIFGAFLDLTPEGTAPLSRPWKPQPVPGPSELFRDNVRRRQAELTRALVGLGHPGRTARAARQALPAWKEVLTERPAPRTSLNRPVGADRRMVVVSSSVAALKEVAHSYEAKINDVVLAAVAGGLRQLLEGRGEDVRGLTQRAMVTITDHDPGAHRTGGNKPSWMMVSLPVGQHDPVMRLKSITAETAARKNRARPEVGSGIFRFVAGQRAWYRFFPRQRSVNIVVSNVPGPQETLYFAGAEVLDLIPTMPTMGNLSLVVAALSYAGHLNIAAVGDRNHCPDIDLFADGVRDSLEELNQHRLSAVP